MAQHINSLLSAGVTLTSTGTAVAAPIPLDSAGYFPQFVRVVATGAGCYVKAGGIGVTAVAGDCMVQPLDGLVLRVSGCKAISALTVTGTSSVTVVPLERGSWSYDTRTLDYTFTALSALPSSITFARADAITCATYFNSSGVLSTAAANVPRFDYDPVTLLPRGLLIEEARTNLLLQSEDFSTTWGLSNIDAFGSGSVVNAVVSPSGAVTAEFLRESASASLSHTVSQSVTKAAAATAYSYSVYMKAGTRNWGRLLISNAALTAFASVYVNLTTGAIGVSGATATTFTAQTASVQTLPGGWYRVTLNATTDTDTTVKCWVGIANADNGATYAGDGASGLYVWGASLEAGAFPTSYIPTTTAAVTRAADSVSMTGTNFSSWYSQTQGTFVVEGDAYQKSVQQTFCSADNGTNNDRIEIAIGAAGFPRTQVAVAGVSQADMNGATTKWNAVLKQAVAYQASNFAQYVDSVAAGSSATGSVPTADRLAIGNRSGGGTQLNGHIRRIQYYTTRLPNATLQTLTA